ncbi:YceI family protein [Pontibacter sp. KCTC 32443]|uniref:YceI family protein n=1 Tax=Pontibacter TaxID=323449 RepID=UPI00164D1FF4|nr:MULTISPECIES: YceI family protein [Pontibacter]MBC5773745.1 YceI family protein [Pontibacter sp. KCTC 32443]
MKKVAILASLAGALIMTAYAGNTTKTETAVVTTEVAAPAKGRVYNALIDKSEVKWNGKKVGGEHFGAIDLKSGNLTVNKDKVTGGKFVIDMNSITVEDIKDAEYNGKLVGHLKNDDFFSVEKFPTATFEIKSLAPIAKAAAGKPNYKVNGLLTIKGITKPVQFPATITVKNGVANAKGTVTVNRAQYDVKYGSETFFGSLGDKAIMDDFTINFNVTAKQ